MATHRLFSLAVTMSAAALLAACGGEGSSTQAGTAVTTPTPAPSPSPSPTPSPTPTSSNAGQAIAFVDPDNGDIPDKANHPFAFPTALGFGRETSVRSPNAVVYKINSLEDSANPDDGKITYRECALALQVNSPYSIPAGRPRYCVFDVSGAIILQSSAFIKTPRIYIAGQTSPGGIEFRLGSNYNPVDSLIDTRNGGDHLILRHIRARLGEHPGRSSDNGDPIRLQSTNYQIVDHVSSMFGTDESLDTSCRNCTIQWSVIGPNICRNAGHSSSLHCKTFFLKPVGNVTVAYNLSQHGEQRGLNFAPGINPIVSGTTSQADIFNNVLYHFISETGVMSNQFGSAYANMMNNVSLRGPYYNGSDGNYFPVLHERDTSGKFGFSLYMKNNVTPRTRVSGQFGQTTTDPHQSSAGFFSGVSPSSICGVDSNGNRNCSINGLNVIQSNNWVRAPSVPKLLFEDWQVVSPEQAMRSVLAFAGADRCRDGSCRDNVDKMYIDDVRTCDAPPYLFDTGWTSTVADSGGFAKLTSTGGALPDRDNDGMPDAWEDQFANTNADVWDANADPDGDGYPNIEEYLNFLALDHERYKNIYTAGTGALPKYNCGRPMF